VSQLVKCVRCQNPRSAEAHLNQHPIASALNTYLNKAKTPHKSASAASRDAKTNSVAPKQASTVQKLTPKPPNHRNKCPAHRDTILFQLLSKNIKGEIKCFSVVGKGTEFRIEISIQRTKK